VFFFFAVVFPRSDSGESPRRDLSGTRVESNDLYTSVMTSRLDCYERLWSSQSIRTHLPLGCLAVQLIHRHLTLFFDMESIGTYVYSWSIFTSFSFDGRRECHRIYHFSSVIRGSRPALFRRFRCASRTKRVHRDGWTAGGSAISD